MATKDDAKRKARKKLTLTKQTIRDLTVTNHHAQAVKAGKMASTSCPKTFGSTC